MIYEFKGLMENKTIVFNVIYSEKGRITKIKDYIQKFYKNKERETIKNNLEVELLTDKHSNMFPEGKNIILKFPRKSETENSEKIRNEIEDFINQLESYNSDENNLSQKLEERFDFDSSFIVHFDNHLYTPLIIWKEDRKEIISIPVKLNEGETEFLRDFKKFLIQNKIKFKDYEIFLLRNLSKRGIGFFSDNSGFYPDFILWIKNKNGNENKQHMVFIDPKGIRNLGNFHDDKIRFIHYIEKEINEKIKNEFNVNLQLHAFIISVSRYEDIKETFGEGNHSQKEFEEYNIFFLEDKGNNRYDYLEKICKKIFSSDEKKQTK